jgi:hypothetical protein
VWCLQEDKEIEEMHAMIRQRNPKGESLRIYPYDLNFNHSVSQERERNGWRVFVNDKQLTGGKSLKIRDGDTIVLGQSTFILAITYFYNSTADILNRVDRYINTNQATTPANLVVAAPRIN